MATKTITISEDAYNRLEMQKKDGESFSDVIIRLTSQRGKLSDLAGLLSKKDADEMEASIRELRAEFTKSMDRRAEEIRDALDNR